MDTRVKEQRFKDYEIIEILNKWANSYKNFFGVSGESVSKMHEKEETESEFVNDEHGNIKEDNNISETAKADSANTQIEKIDLSAVVKESKKITVKKLLTIAEVAVKSYLAKFKKPFVYRYEKDGKIQLIQKRLRKWNQIYDIFLLYNLCLALNSLHLSRQYLCSQADMS
jgi:hypothetical protein